MRREYSKPEIKEVNIEIEDIIAASSTTSNSGWLPWI